MTGDVRDRILSLLRAGPATVARLSAGLGVAGGVVSYELKLLERDGLVRVGTTRREQGVATPVYVNTAAAAPPALRVPPPIPGLTWIGDEPYPTPLWTVPQPPDPDERLEAARPTPDTDPTGRPATGRRTPDTDPAGRPATGRPTPDTGPAGRPAADPTDSAWSPPAGPSYPGERPEPASRPGNDAGRPGNDAGRSGDDAGGPAGGGSREPRRSAASPNPATSEHTGSSPSLPRPPQPRRFDPESPRGPRLQDVRRVPLDDATFYEFAERLDALAREFAARATPGAPAAELTILLTRPGGDSIGYGS